ncbi:class I SAM-dependent methyltransferase [Pedobacter hiemivivus]|uniref:Methyltransferase domain-containing protein n=1 Tax=Pedobacter hiemivivus TaxID=2530454 RepID=A0A4R0MZH5_9SPHI|nr:methyltransferase domain-containing protein [Pedobacter hiemivivus]TCC92725.1 methyltransferase domain-containing protein [Pedobacter hiemivivus]
MLKLKSYFQRPEKGYDPVPLAYAAGYTDFEFKKIDTELVNKIGIFSDGFTNKTLLDLGGGPGQYSIEFAKQGAAVTWHDISKNYLDIASQKSKTEDVDIKFSLGYLESAKGKYDILFNRICWYYCFNDYKFADLIVSLVNDGGYGYIIVNNENWLFSKIKKEKLVKKIYLSLNYWFNEIFDIKFIHIHPSHKKLKKVFSKFNFSYLNVERENLNTVISFKK